MNQDTTHENLIRKHEIEKKQFIQEFHAFKVKSLENETKLSHEYQTKYNTLRDEAKNMNEKFQEKITLFENFSIAMRRSLDESNRLHDINVNELRRKHDSDINMMKDGFKSHLVKEVNKTRDEVTVMLKLQYEKELGRYAIHNNMLMLLTVDLYFLMIYF